MCEFFGINVPSGHFLEPVVSNRGSRPHASFNIILVDDISLFGGLGPNAGKAVRLQLQLDRRGIRFSRVIPTEALRSAFDSE